ncbi:hypothetical protein ACSBR2_041748 [Camellia fascicularis]
MEHSVLAVVVAVVQLLNRKGYREREWRNGWAIALHGGAGDIPVTLPPERRVPPEATLRRCLDIGVAALQSKHSPLDVVELVVTLSLSLDRSSYCYLASSI